MSVYALDNNCSRPAKGARLRASDDPGPGPHDESFPLGAPGSRLYARFAPVAGTRAFVHPPRVALQPSLC